MPVFYVLGLLYSILPFLIFYFGYLDAPDRRMYEYYPKPFNPNSCNPRLWMLKAILKSSEVNTMYQNGAIYRKRKGVGLLKSVRVLICP